MPEVVLGGCRPEPLASYLKALGVLRLVAEQKDPEALGWWRDEQFVLASALSEEELVRFFAEEYRPTPVVAPWNKDSGFYRSGTVVEAIERSSDGRLADFREAISAARAVLKVFSWQEEPGSGEEKLEVIAALRSRLPESSVRWLDVVVTIGEDATWAPLFVAGGADGRFEFTRVYAEAVLEILGIGVGRRSTGATDRGAGAGLRMALFATTEPRAAKESTGGLLLPGTVDAPNAAQGFVGKGRVNPWDYVLAVEGALVLAGAVSRRFGPAAGTRAAFPFCVDAATAGHPSAGEEPSRGELWLPIWQRPMTARELEHLFREGRAEWRGRPVSTATDMARAIISLGVARGLTEFRRFGVQGRSGRTHLAVALGRWPVTARPEAELLGELDTFLGGLRRAAGGSDAPAALRRALRELDAVILEYTAVGGRARLLAVLLALREAELALARRPRTRARGFPRPVSGLSGRWVVACDDGSAEFELAAAVASLRPAQRSARTFREHVEPVVRGAGGWRWADEVPRETVWMGRDPLRDLGAVLERRLVDAEREGIAPPLDGGLRADPRSVIALLEGDLDMHRFGQFVEALALVDWGSIEWTAEPVRLAPRVRSPEAALPATYAILKLAFLGRPVRLGELEVSIRPDATILGLLRAGDVWGATVRAARRLRAAGLTVKGIPRDERRAPIGPDPEAGRRLLAALVVPVHEGPLVRAVLKEGEAREEGGLT